MAKTIASLLFISFVIFLTFATSQKTFAQEKGRNASLYFDYLRHAVLELTYLTPTPQEVLGAAITPTPSPTALPTPIPTVQSSDVSNFLLSKVNAYRASFNLPPVKSSTQVCAFATLRAKEIVTHFTHDGFNTRTADHTIPYDKWARATENIAEAPDYQEVVDLWAKSPEHAANMRDITPYVCIEESGPYFAYEGMRP